MSLINLIPLQKRGDQRGHLCVAEFEKEIPFEIKRVYWIYGTAQGIERGFHAHKQLKQVAVAVAGSCEIELNDGKSTETVTLQSPDQGLVIGPGIWRVMRNFSEDCVLLVFADALYNEADYIRNYEEFLNYNVI